MAKPLHHLTKKDVVWNWTGVEESAYDNIVESLCSNQVLVKYDPEEDLTLLVDACQSGLGAVLLQNGRPVEYTSSAMTDAQQRYAQCEKSSSWLLFMAAKRSTSIFGARL